LGSHHDDDGPRIAWRAQQRPISIDERHINLVELGDGPLLAFVRGLRELHVADDLAFLGG
jgi:hypothetical protein